MDQLRDLNDVKKVASAMNAEIRALPVQNTPNVRAIRRNYSRQLKQADPAFILNLSRELLGSYGRRWVAYELVQSHKTAFQSIGVAELYFPELHVAPKKREDNA